MGTRDWSNLQVTEATRSFIKESGFARMTPVQAIAIPLLLNRRDVAVEACTGSGKTLAFLIPTVEILLRSDTPPAGTFNVGCLALAPTRELAGQIHEVLGAYLEAVVRQDSKHAAKIGKMLMVGGSDVKVSATSIQRADSEAQLHVIVATPGRLCAVLGLTGTSLNCKSLEVLVLDEADRLLELGFSRDIDTILAALPKQRRTGLFSATLTSELKVLMKTGMRNPVHVCVRRKAAAEPAGEPSGENGQEAAALAASSGTRHELPAKLQNFFATVPAARRLGFLLRFLGLPEVRKGKTIVFFLTCACCDFFHALLRSHIDAMGSGGRKGQKQRKAAAGGGRVEKLHGQMEQNARTKAYGKFCNSSAEDGGILLATDLAARGIDVDNVDWIVQFDAPTDPNAFVHRVGRTARAGHSGKSLVLLQPHEDSYIPFLRRRGIEVEEMIKMPGVVDDVDDEQFSEKVLQRSRKLLETDRAVMLKGAKAYVSYIRAYQEHQLSYVFPFKGLELGSVATGYCLLRMPRMKEILGRKIKHFQQSSVNPANVPFRDKKQEKLRQERLKKQWEEGGQTWEQGAEAEDDPLKEKREKDAKAAEKKKLNEEKERTRTEKRKAGRKGRADEWKLLQAEERLAKKIRKGHINAEEFEKGVRKTAQKLNMSDEEDVAENAGGDANDSDDDSSAAREKKMKRKVNGLSSEEKKGTRWMNGRKRRRKKGRK